VTENESLEEKAKRLTMETCKIITLAVALRRSAEQLEKETWQFVKELEKGKDAGRQAA
jgi:hypothetical protein